MAVLVRPASAQAGHNGPSWRSAIAEVGHSSDTNNNSAGPPAVRSAMVTSPGPVPRTRSAGAGPLPPVPGLPGGRGSVVIDPAQALDLGAAPLLGQPPLARRAARLRRAAGLWRRGGRLGE